MQTKKYKNQFCNSSKNVESASNRIKKIFHIKYEIANLKKITTKLKYLNSDKQFLIYSLLKKHEYMVDGTLGNYNSTEYKIELLEGAQPYHVKPFPVLKVHEETMKRELNRLVSIGVLKHKNNS